MSEPGARGAIPGVADDAGFLDLALAEAQGALAHDDVPIGAVVVHDGQVVGRGHNRREADRDPTAHAEILALRASASALGRWRLQGCTLYVTLEPCAMCAGAAVLARVDLVVFAAWDPKAGAVRSVAELLDEPAFNHRPKWRAGTRRSEAEALLTGFFAARRAAGRDAGGGP
ncbi:MAG TPA: nucleoside deaminase [Candidatus Saccharimonadales bacterium]|nr:nucleoside deaminase [Candidatus Saccharimonadales bacterium]